MAKACHWCRGCVSCQQPRRARAARKCVGSPAEWLPAPAAEQWQRRAAAAAGRRLARRHPVQHTVILLPPANQMRRPAVLRAPCSYAPHVLVTGAALGVSTRRQHQATPFSVKPKSLNITPSMALSMCRRPRKAIARKAGRGAAQRPQRPSPRPAAPQPGSAQPPPGAPARLAPRPPAAARPAAAPAGRPLPSPRICYAYAFFSNFVDPMFPGQLPC